MPRRKQPDRDGEIARALDHDKADARELAGQYGLSVSAVYRAAERARRGETAHGSAGGPRRSEGFATAPADAAQAIPSAQRLGGVSFRGLAKTGLRRFGGSIYDDYDLVFRTLNRRIQLYREMGDDPVCAAVIQACKMTIRRAELYGETDGKTDADKQGADFLEQCWDDMEQTGTDTVDQATNMLQYGFAPAEMVYKKRRGPKAPVASIPQVSGPLTAYQSLPAMPATSKYADGRIGWRRWVFMAPESLTPGNEWVWSADGQVVGISQMAPPEFQVVTIPMAKVVNFRASAEKNNPEGRALFRAMYKPWYFKTNLEEVEAISAERTGTGFPVVYLGDGTQRAGNSGDDLDTFKTITRDIRVDEQMALVIPYPKMGLGNKGEGVLFEFATPPPHTMNFGEMITRYEQRIAMVGLAQFIHLGMSGVGARALGSVQQDFFLLAVSAWLDAVVDTINRSAVEQLFAYNYFPGLTTIPRLAHEAVTETDIVKVANYINLLVGAQVLTPSEDLERYVLELADLPTPQNLEELWTQKATDTAAANAAKTGTTATDPSSPTSAGDSAAGGTQAASLPPRPSAPPDGTKIAASNQTVRLDPETLSALRGAVQAIETARAA